MSPSQKIAVLAGGPSCEREISLISGKAVLEALVSLGIETCLIDPVGNFLEELKRENISFVFLALHGTFGEDGTIQRILDEARIKYTGSGRRASELSFDKSLTQAFFQKKGIPVPAYCSFKEDSVPALEKIFSFPFIVKPAKSGSSVGISLVDSKEGISRACAEAFQFSDIVLAEQYIEGRELTVGILGEEALPVVEVIPKRKFYDYEAKYEDAGTRYEVPARLPHETEHELKKIALEAYHALGCEVMGRVDILLDKENRPYVLEINTIPGLTGKSLLPKAACAAGIEFAGLCVKILELSESKHKGVAWLAR